MHEEGHDHQLLASLAIDGEIDRDELIALLDVMADDGECRDFWRAARATQSLIERVSPAAATSIPYSTEGARRHGHATRRWVAAVAATVVVVLGISTWGSGLLDPAPADAVSLRLGEAPDSMDDERFVEIAVELLRADPRYRAEMAHLLDDVAVDTFVTESIAHERRGARESRIARSDLDTDFDRPEHSPAPAPPAF